MKKHFIDTLRKQKWSLHFYGKRIGRTEYQVVMTKNETKKMKLAFLNVCDGKAWTIAEGLKNILNEC